MTYYVQAVVLCSMVLPAVMKVYLSLLCGSVDPKSFIGKLTAFVLFVVAVGFVFLSVLWPISIWRTDTENLPKYLAILPPLLNIIYLIIFERHRLSQLQKRYSYQ